MKNKVKFKKYLFITSIISVILLGFFLAINVYEYSTYTNNFNQKIDLIIAKVEGKYPEISEDEIMDIINSNVKNQDSIFKQYGVNLKKESAILENTKSFYKFLIVEGLFIVTSFSIIVIIFLKYDRKKDRDISEITKYIEEINRRNYTLHIDEISEDELSILKNEIYKTTIMLKESADNSLKDKKELKKSLEDISHQIKTPLTSILVILDNLIDDPDMDSKTRDEFIRDIKREVTKISFLIQSLLKLSKLDSNTINFINEERLLKEIIDESIKNVSMLCDLKDITIEYKGDKHARITCDFMWQVEAITNILKNCIEHSSNNSKIIIKYEQNKVYSSITIQDFGEGIDKQDLPHIFERFYKGKNASPDSVGIGLALSKTIIENNNGTISVESNNMGTKFIIKYFGI